MIDVIKIRALCESHLVDTNNSFHQLTCFIDEFVSSDKVYELDENRQLAIFNLQEDLARFDDTQQLAPDPGFLNADQVRKAIKLFLFQMN